MHELDIAKKIAKTVIDESKKTGLSKITKLNIKAGRTQAIDPSQLGYFLKEQSGCFDNCLVNVNVIDVKLECDKCKNLFNDERFLDEHFAHEYSHAPFLYISPKCPKCGCENSKMICGNELEIVSIDGE